MHFSFLPPSFFFFSFFTFHFVPVQSITLCPPHVSLHSVWPQRPLLSALYSLILFSFVPSSLKRSLCFIDTPRLYFSVFILCLPVLYFLNCCVNGATVCSHFRLSGFSYMLLTTCSFCRLPVGTGSDKGKVACVSVALQRDLLRAQLRLCLVLCCL